MALIMKKTGGKTCISILFCRRFEHGYDRTNFIGRICNILFKKEKVIKEKYI